MYPWYLNVIKCEGKGVKIILLLGFAVTPTRAKCVNGRFYVVT